MQQKQRRVKKPGHVPVLIRNMPEKLHADIKTIASDLGMTMIQFIMHAAKKEVEFEKSRRNI